LRLPSTQTARAPYRTAFAAGPPSPFSAGDEPRFWRPVPAKVVMTPVFRSRRRTRQSATSAMSRPPLPSRTQSLGSTSRALGPGPPSPAEPPLPVLATGLTLPVLPSILLTQTLSQA